MMYRTSILTLCCLFGFTLSATPMTAVHGPQIKQLISGKLVLLTHASAHIYGTDISTFNNNLAIAYFANGSLTGTFSDSSTGHNSAVRIDTGKWWIEKNQQCYRWDHWQKHKKLCLTWHKVNEMYVLLYNKDSLAGIVEHGNLV